MNWKRVWDGVKEGIIKALPAAIAALIGFAIAKVNKSTQQMQTETKKASVPAPPKRQTRRRRRRH